MPLYEYECTACHKRTEKIQKFSDPEITVCPRCGGSLERVLSAPAISFKGGGWYADGYGNAKPQSSGESSTASDSRSGESQSTESKAGESAGKPTASTDTSTPAPSTPAPAPAAAPSSSKGD